MKRRDFLKATASVHAPFPSHYQRLELANLSSSKTWLRNGESFIGNNWCGNLYRTRIPRYGRHPVA